MTRVLWPHPCNPQMATVTAIWFRWNLRRQADGNQRIVISLLAAMTGALALITLASARLPAVVPSVARAAMPMPATTVAQISDTATIFRWVIRSAVKMEVLFMMLPQTFRVSQLFVAPGLKLG